MLSPKCYVLKLILSLIAYLLELIQKVNPYWEPFIMTLSRFVRVHQLRGSTEEPTGGVYGDIHRGSATREYKVDDVQLRTALIQNDH